MSFSLKFAGFSTLGEGGLRALLGPRVNTGEQGTQATEDEPDWSISVVLIDSVMFVPGQRNAGPADTDEDSTDANAMENLQ